MQEKKNSVTPKIISIVAAVVVIAVFAVVYFAFGPKGVVGEKDVVIVVVNSLGETVKYDVNTDAEFLTGALEDAKDKGLQVSGSVGAYGFTIETVNGETADFVNSYWAIYVNGEYGMYGADSQPVDNGDVFKLEYTSLFSVKD